MVSLSLACAFTPTPQIDQPTTQSTQAQGQPANFDTQTQALMNQAERVVFLIPFSHWDTDWHKDYQDYASRADQNIRKAIELAKEHPRFRYTLEQTLFVQHFWDTHPGYRADLKKLIEIGQIRFAWGGITQPETSLVAPAIQLRNLQQGWTWINDTFGPAALPRTAWQSDAFGNSAAFPLFLQQVNLPYLYIGRWQGRCDPDYDDCEPLAHAFYWQSPLPMPDSVEPARVLVAYLSYPTGWAAIRRPAEVDDHLAALRKIVKTETERSDSRYFLLPIGFDFLDPLPYLPGLVERWNQLDQQTVLVMADADTAFSYLATQELPEISTDFNPVWQAYYASRPQAKIADKKSEYFLTAANKFGLLLNIQPTAWQTATINAHYDNIGAVSFDSVWAKTQRPRFEQTVTTAADELATILARLSSGVEAPFLIFNPTSWPRSEVIELEGKLPSFENLPQPVQQLGPNAVAIWVKNIPAVGFAAPERRPVLPVHLAKATRGAGQVTLSNGLVSVTLDEAHGGTFSSLALLDSAKPDELLTTFGDDITYFNDSGDIYGAFFGQVKAQEHATPARFTLLSEGPLLARVQASFTLGNQPITKTVTLRAESPLVEVTLELAALPETTVLVQTPTILSATTRTDDLGFAAFEHTVDPRPISPGDITYRRDIFYPIISWSDVSQPGAAPLGLSLITHGLQGVAGTNTLAFMLVRSVTGDAEGVTDLEYHTLRYAYLPHRDTATQAQPWLAAYAFNQPLIPVWRSGAAPTKMLNVYFAQGTHTSGVATPGPHFSRQLPVDTAAPSFSLPFSLISADNGLIVDLYRRGDQVEALVINYNPANPTTLQTGQTQTKLKGNWLEIVPVQLKE